MLKNIKKNNIKIIVNNKYVQYNMFISKELEAGIALQGWEVKAIRKKKVNISKSYITIKNNSAYLIGALFQPIVACHPHLVYDQMRSRQLLLKKSELNSLIGYSKINGFTIVVCCLYWKNSYIKAKIGVAKGKTKHDKRLNIKNKEWKIKKMRLLKIKNIS
ncbi:trans-translation protein [Wigglesworthia glossinidia endosymbiont of Glossina morsitans morsitans (Yale colony)]|uniref:SsrA-binding protein n=1 Tax=Wigglesworthia glossinidia endosymbiont of Glossina morsitans morsitans (Yale colony) TaxID=1142511 RepID=H6Q5S3_WIGGL|nr:SsrA-binding protein SmpB [Wigglesworthia glossinidia]AFA40978.1 trans-translation protein [Wigglesworthia glossinidia endosymbiont of Glossina morsitans morsitans (Yale colony)]